MADPEDLAAALQGHPALTRWRENQSDARRKGWPELDLTHADLRGAASLAHATLTDADMRWADLRGVVLENAALYRADLRFCRADGAILRSAQMAGAYLTRASFIDATLDRIHPGAMTGFNDGMVCHGTNFARASFRDADLRFADLREANLAGADLSRALFGQTMLGATVLTGATGLESCRHWAPSTVDLATVDGLAALPTDFLRGCGLPDPLIEVLPRLADQAGAFRCFISYSTDDAEFALLLHERLQRAGVRCWFAPHDMKTGTTPRVALDLAIQRSNRLVLVLSQHSIESRWVEKEVETALERERVENVSLVFPIRLDDAAMDVMVGWPADIRRTKHIRDFRGWQLHAEFDLALNGLLRDFQN